jgi:hypothetical protein
MARVAVPKLFAVLVLTAWAASLAFAYEGSSDLAQSDVDPDRAKQQAERVMNAGLPFAEKMLAEHSEFAPFGAVMLPHGLIQTLGASDDRETVPTEEIFEKLQDGLREGAQQQRYIAIATFAMVELRNPRGGEMLTAVHVALEHHDGYCVDVFYPTVLRGDTLVLGDSFGRKREGTLFESCL